MTPNQIGSMPYLPSTGYSSGTVITIMPMLSTSQPSTVYSTNNAAKNWKWLEQPERADQREGDAHRRQRRRLSATERSSDTVTATEPIGISSCGIHSGAASSVGATSPECHDCSTKRVSCQISTAQNPSDSRSNSRCDTACHRGGSRDWMNCT